MPTRPTPLISESLKADRLALDAIYDRILGTRDRNEQIRYQNLFVWELARHIVAEEIVVYPAIEKHVGFVGGRIAGEGREEGLALKTQLKIFQHLDPTHRDFTPVLTSLMDDLSTHMATEEAEDLVMLEGALTEKDSRSMSKAFNRTKIFLPSRAHPGQPNKPPLEMAVGLLTAPVDQFGDLFRKWP